MEIIWIVELMEEKERGISLKENGIFDLGKRGKGGDEKVGSGAARDEVWKVILDRQRQEEL